MRILLSRSWDEQRGKSLNLNKYINLGDIKRNEEFASYICTRYSTSLVTCIIFLVQGPSQYQPRCWMGHPGEIKYTLPYLTLPYKRKHKLGNELVMWHVMFKIAEKDHCSSNPDWNPGSDPSSNPGSDSSSNPGSNRGSKFRYPPSNLKLPSNRLRTLNVPPGFFPSCMLILQFRFTKLR